MVMLDAEFKARSPGGSAGGPRFIDGKFMLIDGAWGFMMVNSCFVDGDVIGKWIIYVVHFMVDDGSWLVIDIYEYLDHGYMFYVHNMY